MTRPAPGPPGTDVVTLDGAWLRPRSDGDGFEVGDSRDPIEKVLSVLGQVHAAAGKVNDIVTTTGRIRDGLGQLFRESGTTLVTCAGSSVVPFALPALGLLNIGVSAASAVALHKLLADQRDLRRHVGQIEELAGTVVVQVHGVDRRVQQLSAYLRGAHDRLEALVERQARTLAVLITESNNVLGETLTTLGQEMYAGFERLEERLASLEAREQMRQMGDRLRAMLRSHGQVVLTLAAGEQPMREDLQRTIDDCHAAITWLHGRIAEYPVGDARRLAFFVALAVANRIEWDARALLHSAPVLAEQEREHLAASVRSELEVLVQTLPPYCLRHTSGLLDSYVFLHRALTRRGIVGWSADRGLIPVADLNDVLWGGFTPAASSRPAFKPFALDSLERRRLYSWNCAMPQDAPAALDLESVRTLLGVPPSITPSHNMIEELMRVGIPPSRARLITTLRAEFERCQR